jgi:hypothetical protein
MYRVYVRLLEPAVLITVLEDLIAEGVMAPVAARRIENNVLAMTDVRGQWKGTA